MVGGGEERDRGGGARRGGEGASVVDEDVWSLGGEDGAGVATAGGERPQWEGVAPQRSAAAGGGGGVRPYGWLTRPRRRRACPGEHSPRSCRGPHGGVGGGESGRRPTAAGDRFLSLWGVALHVRRDPSPPPHGLFLFLAAGRATSEDLRGAGASLLLFFSFLCWRARTVLVQGAVTRWHSSGAPPRGRPRPRFLPSGVRPCQGPRIPTTPLYSTVPPHPPLRACGGHTTQTSWAAAPAAAAPASVPPVLRGTALPTAAVRVLPPRLDGGRPQPGVDGGGRTPPLLGAHTHPPPPPPHRHGQAGFCP